jgi:hypothetical protein
LTPLVPKMPGHSLFRNWNSSSVCAPFTFTLSKIGNLHACVRACRACSACDNAGVKTAEYSSTRSKVY